MGELPHEVVRGSFLAFPTDPVFPSGMPRTQTDSALSGERLAEIAEVRAEGVQRVFTLKSGGKTARTREVLPDLPTLPAGGSKPQRTPGRRFDSAEARRSSSFSAEHGQFFLDCAREQSAHSMKSQSGRSSEALKHLIRILARQVARDVELEPGADHSAGR
jgi:hypothetical protein